MRSDDLEKAITDAMDDPAVTRVSGWTEPGGEAGCDEEGYRLRLAENAAAFHAKVDEVFRMIG